MFLQFSHRTLFNFVKIFIKPDVPDSSHPQAEHPLRDLSPQSHHFKSRGIGKHAGLRKHSFSSENHNFATVAGSKFLMS
jgi:hypothetical protein